jgi:hypothetical protein
MKGTTLLESTGLHFASTRDSAGLLSLPGSRPVLNINEFRVARDAVRVQDVGTAKYDRSRFELGYAERGKAW